MGLAYPDEDDDSDDEPALDLGTCIHGVYVDERCSVCDEDDESEGIE